MNEQPAPTGNQPGAPQQPQPQPQLQQPMHQPPQAPKQNSLMWLWIALGSLLVLLLLGVGIFFLTKALSKPDTTKDTLKDTVTKVETNTDTQKTPTPSQSATACLTADLVRSASSTASAPNPYTPNGYQTSITVFFQPDSSEYDTEAAASQTDDVNMLADWAKANKDKKFHLEITAKVNAGALTSAGTQLATQRGEKLKQALMARGVTESQIRIMPNESETGDDASTQSSRRNVRIDVIGDC